MNPLSPKQAGLIATHVYDTRVLDMERISENASVNGLADLFNFSTGQKSSGTSGAVLRKTTGFAYALDGVGGRQGEVLLAFRGTDIIPDWLTDGNFGLQRGPSTWPVHAGFNETFKSLRDDVNSFMRGRNPSAVHCVGHSLGGALASLAADHLSEIGVSGIKLYTFGAPRVGVSGFARNLTNKLGKGNIHRVYHNADPVSMIPIFPYTHAPDDGPVCMLPWPGGSFAFSAHKMENYRNSIGDASWTGLQRMQQTALDRDIEAWLDNANGSVMMLSATSMWMISRALQYVLKKAAGVVAGGLLTAGLTAVDQIAGILIQGAQICKDIAESLGSLIVKIFKFLGRPIPAATNLTSAFLRWVLDMLVSAISNLARQAIQVTTKR